MTQQLAGSNRKARSGISWFAVLALLAVTLVARPASATTYLSAEPIPSGDVVGQANLDKILNIGYANLELWSNRLLNSCQVVDSVIGALQANGAISTINSTNRKVIVAAGGFEAITDPSYVFTIQDAGAGAVSQADVNTLSNALGFVLNQSGTAISARITPRPTPFPWTMR